MFSPNPGKNLTITVNNEQWQRFPIKTHTITETENISDVIKKYAAPFFQPNDYLFLSEKAVAITQGRSIHIDQIKVSWLAKFLTKFVTKSPYGIGLSIPPTMQMAINEVGVFRILLAAGIAAITKPLGIKGMFYHIAGKQARGIDGPTEYTIPPYNKHATLAPKNPYKVAIELAKQFGINVVIIDANDLGVNMLGSNKGVNQKWAEAVFKDNPLGQTNESTPLCIVRKTI
jgi:F420-0:gamma-glutamyl ligase-like protein